MNLLTYGELLAIALLAVAAFYAVPVPTEVLREIRVKVDDAECG